MHPNLPDQPNRRVRTRTHGGVGGGRCEAPPYPDSRILYLPQIIEEIKPVLCLLSKSLSQMDFAN